MRPVLFLLLALLIIGADQISKWYVMEHILRPTLPVATETTEPPAVPDFIAWYKQAPERMPPTELVVLPNFNLVSVWNKGISFGMFNRASDNGPMILVGLSLAISALFVIWLFRGPDAMQCMGIILVIGGALGNVFDRLRFGAVFDFLDFHAFDYHWPAFNIADSGIVVGVAVLVIHSFFFEKDA
jgi:signal peptidase II